MSANDELYRPLVDELTAKLVLLADKPEETGESTLRALWFAAAGNPKSAQAAAAASLPSLDARGVTALRSLVARRVAGEPLSHLTERQQFMGLEMLAGREALVPRKETELLARAAIDLTNAAAANGTPRVLDLCTGSGNIAVSVAYHAPAAEVFASDLSETAIELARRNAAHLGLGERIDFRASDLLVAFERPEFMERFDVITCNPPYISSGKVGQMPKEISEHEPRLAFDGGALGISILMRLIQDAPRFLRKGGWLAFEVGLGQGPALVKRLQAGKLYERVEAKQDHAGQIRVVAARR